MPTSFYTLRAPRAASNPTVNVLPVEHIWGFDPFQLLETVEFPNDKYEKILRRNKAARLMAIRRIPISVSEDPVAPSIEAISTPAASSNARRSTQSRRRSVAVPLPSQDRVNSQDEIALRGQLARLAATLMLQALYRGWRTRRKYVAVVYGRLSTATHRLSPPDVGIGVSTAFQGELPSIDAHDFTVQEKLLRRYYKYCSFIEARNPLSLPPTFPDFAAAYIQAIWRMWVARRNWLKYQQMKAGGAESDEDAKKEMLRKARRAGVQHTTWDEAARKIQRVWRSFYNRKIYRFHRDLIRFRLRGDPRKLLKFINPQEAGLIDAAMAIHVRFRLGGTSFPPTIYYKIFVHKSLVDMNSFSPRDYTSQDNKQLLPVDLFDKMGPLLKSNPVGWYQRFENNGWRPVSDKMLDEHQDTTAQLAATKTIMYHHVKLKRRAEIDKAKRKRKLDWLRKMYQEGKRMMQTENGEEHSAEEHEKNKSSGGMVTSAPKQSPSTPDLKSDEYLTEVEADMDTDLLIRWSNALDFETYFDNWVGLATSGKSDDPVTFSFPMPDTIAAIAHMKDAYDENSAGDRSSDGEDRGATEDTSVRKLRPWSGKSDRSVRDLMVSQREMLDF